MPFARSFVLSVLPVPAGPCGAQPIINNHNNGNDNDGNHNSNNNNNNSNNNE